MNSDSLSASGDVSISRTWSVDSTELEEGKKLATEDTELPSREEVEKETRDALAAKGKAEGYYGMPEHPEESKATQFKHKVGRFLNPLSSVAGRTAQVLGGGTMMLGILMGLPGIPYFLVGAGAFRLGSSLRVRQKNFKQEVEFLKRHIRYIGLHDDELHKTIKGHFKEWREGRGSRTLQRIKFEVLEATIQVDESASKLPKTQGLLESFKGKQVGSREYRKLLKSYVNERKGYPSYCIALIKNIGSPKQRDIIEKEQQKEWKLRRSQEALLEELVAEFPEEEIQEKQITVLGRLLGFKSKSSEASHE